MVIKCNQTFISGTRSKARERSQACSTIQRYPRSCLHWFRGLDEYSNYWISLSFFWAHKIVILYLVDVVLDCIQANNHYKNSNSTWGLLTILFVFLPNIPCSINTLATGKCKTWKKALKQLFFLHFVTVCR